jgi:hypothetical protein
MTRLQTEISRNLGSVPRKDRAVFSFSGIQWVYNPPAFYLMLPGAIFLAVILPVYETDHSPPHSDQNKNAWSYTSTTPCSSWHDA